MVARVGLVLLALAGSVPAALAMPPPGRWAPGPSITVRGSCTATAEPDRAQLAATVLRQGADPASAAADTTTTYNRFRADVAALKLPDLVLRSDGVQTARLTETDAQGHERITGYQGSATLTVESSAVARLAEVMRVAAQDGVDEMSPMSVFVSEATRERLIGDCLPQAAADARAKAQALLRGLGLAPGPVLRVDGFEAQGAERPGGGPPMPVGFAAKMAAPVADIATGPALITVTTTVTFGLPGERAPAP